MYTQDNDERYPLTVLPSGGLIYGWVGSTEPYVKSTQVYQCPSESVGPSSTPANFGSRGVTDYWYNALLAPHHTNGAWSGSPSEAAALNVSLTILLGDGGGTSTEDSNPGRRGRYGATGCSSRDHTYVPGSGAAAGIATNSFLGAGQRHLEGLNLAFLDGHVKWYKAETENSSSVIYNCNTGFTSTTPSSGNNPTFNVILP